MNVTILIGLLATATICVQNASSVLAFGWGLIHGGGPAALMAFLPATIGLIVLWVGYVFVNRRKVRRATLTFTVYAAAILLLNELLLPETPLKAWRDRRASDSVQVRKIRDGPFLSELKNPIGIRITYDVVVRQTAPLLISASAFSPVTDNVPGALRFSLWMRSVIAPPPARQEGAYSVFENGVVYTITADLLPDFMDYDDKTKRPCLRDVTRPYFSQAEFLSALSNSRDLKYRTAILVHGEHSSESVVAAEYVTSRGYDLEAMYRTIATEGNRRCGS